jgi:hypothetical protein
LIHDLAELADEHGRIGPVQVMRPGDDGTEPSAPEFPQEDPSPRPDSVPPQRQPLRTPGAIALLRLDPNHYLSLGEDELAYAPVLSDRLLLPSIQGRNVARFDQEQPRVSGFMWEVMEQALRGKAYLVEEKRGRGRVVLFAEDPGFRGIWEGLHRLLLNAALVGPSIPTRS